MNGDELFNEEEYLKECEIIDNKFKKCLFSISMSLSELDKPISNSNSVVIEISHTCYCYDKHKRPPVVYTVYKKKKNQFITNTDLIEKLIQNKYNPMCNHQFLELFEEIRPGVFSPFFGS